MKQITYSYDLDQLIASLISDIHDIEDGYYRLSFLVETVPAVIDKLHPSQREGFFPGVMSRIVGAELIRVSEPGPLTMRVLDRMIVAGEIADGFYRDQSGFVADGEIVEEDSGRFGQGDSPRGEDDSHSDETSRRLRLIRPGTGRGR